MRKAEKEARYEVVILNICNYFFTFSALISPNRYVSEVQGILPGVLENLKLKTLYFLLDVKYLFTRPALALRARVCISGSVCAKESGELSGAAQKILWRVAGELSPKHLQVMKSPGFAQMS